MEAGARVSGGLPDRVLREMSAGELRAYMETQRVGQGHDRERSVRAAELYEELRLLSTGELIARAGIDWTSARAVLIADIIEKELSQ